MIEYMDDKHSLEMTYLKSTVRICADFNRTNSSCVSRALRRKGEAESVRLGLEGHTVVGVHKVVPGQIQQIL